MRFTALATDYDETLADEGRVAGRTAAALERVKASGRRLVLVTGRELPDLRRVFPRVGELFDAVVAENGAVLWVAAAREESLLGEPPPPAFYQALQRRGCDPLSAGRVIVSTREPWHEAVLEEIRAQGLELQVVFNKGAVMVLPSGVNKGTGLSAGLSALGLSPRNCVAIGDAENDHAFLAEAEIGVAVANALPSLREKADAVTQARAGAGVVEVIEALLRDDLAEIAARSRRRGALLGQLVGGGAAQLPACGERVLFAGPSGAGKSTAAKGFLERLMGAGYQCCIIDPEGDYDDFPGTLRLGEGRRAPTVDEVLAALESPREQLVVNLLGVALADRPAFLATLLPRLHELRGRTGRPHWLVLDETHHLLPATWQPAETTLAKAPGGLMLVTMVPHDISEALLADVRWVVAVGGDAPGTLYDFCRTVGEPAPERSDQPLGQGEALLWRRGDEAPRRVRVQPPRAAHRRHVRKYAQGELAPERSFWFRGPQGKLNLRAQNLTLFAQLAAGVDEDTWTHHLRQGDYSRWFREFVKDDDLADEAQRIERDRALDARESCRRIVEAIDRRYTLGSGGVE